jgi:hypothetical protein
LTKNETLIAIYGNTQQYDPYENAIAERIKGILKYESDSKKPSNHYKLPTK